ncbi:MAG: nitroreductase family protein [Candidatus Limnocylindrales bacterium]
MDAYEAILKRKSVRDFQPKAIDAKTIRRIVDAGLRAPSHNHMREWEFVVVQDQPIRLRLIDKVQEHFTREGVAAWLDSWGSTDPIQRESYLIAVPKQYRMLLEAACLILPFFRQPWPLLKPDCLSALNPFASIWCCIENMLIAASAEGIYGVTRIPMGAEIEHIKEVVKCPSDYEIPCYLALGYPSDNASKIEPYPVKVEEKIHWNSW